MRAALAQPSKILLPPVSGVPRIVCRTRFPQQNALDSLENFCYPLFPQYVTRGVPGSVRQARKILYQVFPEYVALVIGYKDAPSGARQARKILRQHVPGIIGLKRSGLSATKTLRAVHARAEKYCINIMPDGQKKNLLSVVYGEQRCGDALLRRCGQYPIG